MTTKNNIKKNYIYNLIYQLFALLTPIITIPYISRVLTSSGVGQYSFTYSLVTYFTIFASLGFNFYAQREIARHQGDKYNQSKIFREIILARLVSVGCSLILYVILILTGIYGEIYTTLMWLQTINILAILFDISFLFQGNEEFGIIALRNIIIKCVGILAIFIFVKNSSHVRIYVLCQSAILIISNLSLWIKVMKFLVKVPFKELNIKRHYRPTIRLFIPTIAVSIYTMLDKTLIGVMIQGTIKNAAGEIVSVSDIENGYYEQSEKLVKMAMTVITSLGTVMIPRNSQAIATNNMDEFNKNIDGALKFVFFLGVPIMFGLIAIANNFSPWYFGEGFEKVPNLIMMFSPLILIIGLSNVIGLQYLIPLGQDKKYTIAITSGAFLNLSLNLCLIYFFWSYGACIATVISECFITALMLIFARKDISILKVIKNSWKYFVCGILMFTCVYISQLFLIPSILNTVLLILEGILIYFVSLLILHDNVIFNFIKKVNNKFSRK